MFVDGTSSYAQAGIGQDCDATAAQLEITTMATSVLQIHII